MTALPTPNDSVGELLGRARDRAKDAAEKAKGAVQDAADSVVESVGGIMDGLFDTEFRGEEQRPTGPIPRVQTLPEAFTDYVVAIETRKCQEAAEMELERAKAQQQPPSLSGPTLEQAFSAYCEKEERKRTRDRERDRERRRS